MRLLSSGLALGSVCLLLAGCGSKNNDDTITIEGRPSDRYQMTLDIQPVPSAKKESRMKTTLLKRDSELPPRELQIVHERVIHNFIINKDFSSFSHIHHEDFQALTEDDLEKATLHFPYTFPKSGSYRMVSEFTHRGRSRIKHFDIQVGNNTNSEPIINLSREKQFGDFEATLTLVPPTPTENSVTHMNIHISEQGVPVKDVEMYLGSEVHLALWRIDGKFFGHSHALTSHMEKMFNHMSSRDVSPSRRAEMMAEMMINMGDQTQKQEFFGPDVPVRYIFPTEGVYVLFFQIAIDEVARTFDFMIDVSESRSQGNGFTSSDYQPQQLSQ